MLVMTLTPAAVYDVRKTVSNALLLRFTGHTRGSVVDTFGTVLSVSQVMLKDS
jgi:hypothetical protein